MIEQLCQKLQKFGLIMKIKPVFSIENFPACSGTANRHVEDIIQVIGLTLKFICPIKIFG